MQFPDTRWSNVVRARGREPQAQAALSDLCAAYYPKSGNAELAFVQ